MTEAVKEKYETAKYVSTVLSASFMEYCGTSVI